MTTATTAAVTPEESIKKLCEQYAIDKYGAKLKEWEKQTQEIWYLPVLNKDKTAIEKLGIFKMVDRHIMTLAQDKLVQGFYTHVEFIMRETLLNDDDDGKYIIENERAFLSAAPEFNQMIEGLSVAFVKR